MKKTIKKMMNKIKRWFRINQPEDLLRFIQTAPSAYDNDMELINRKDFYESYAKRY